MCVYMHTFFAVFNVNIFDLVFLHTVLGDQFIKVIIFFMLSNNSYAIETISENEKQKYLTFLLLLV